MYKIFHIALAAVAFIISPLFVILAYGNSFYMNTPACIAITLLAVLNIFFSYIDYEDNVLLKRFISITILAVTVLAIISLLFINTLALMIVIIWLVIATIIFIIFTNEIQVLSRTPREQGVVKWFNISKGFGFIKRDSGEDVFVHFKSIRSSRSKILREGQRVEFYVSDHEKGPQAQAVCVLSTNSN